MARHSSTVLERAFATARARRARVVFPEIEAPRVAEACARLAAEGLCTPIPLVQPSEGQLAALTEARRVGEGVARRMLARPLIRAAAMVAAGEADAMVAGAESPTRRVIEAAALAIGPAEGVTLPSSFFLMLFPDGRELIFADCAVNVAPDAAALADIARASAASARALLGEARVALLSFSTGDSGAGASVEMVRDAARRTGFAGPVQADAALNPDVAARKGMGGGGGANCLIFPSLDAGNIAYKLVRELAGAQAIGPLLQGFRRPVCDLSRGASVDDIVKATALCIAMG
ncbi:phosphate acyltransferase [Sagittula salina]|uniref:Phosphate acetyltransferase n=1 Tax=Sagittula salina TaxID=2820268 RepID=A0A940MMQ6_9RHOB|nr:phosphate acyltransferase [Sagittula salina]MBP0484346.1 phosphate acetyltransferase [Sagittula salina]